MPKRKTSAWSYSAGERGRNRVRAYEDDQSGIIFLEFYERPLGSSAPVRKRISTKHRDRDRAKQLADELASKFGQPTTPQLRTTGELTLRTLFDIYLREVTPSKGESKRKHDHRCAEMFLRFFGASRKASTLSRRDWDKFINERRLGAVGPKKAKRGKAVGNRIIAYDLKWLNTVFNWATLAGDGKGGMLLDRNPLRGLKVPKEENPQRPIMLQDRYEKMLAVADKVAPRFGLALVLAHETGHRINSIRQLRWSDIDLQRGVIRWRAENDKTNNEHSTPMSAAALEALKAEQRKNPAVGEAWLFPSPSEPSEPCSRYTLIEWWERAEDAAGLKHVHRMGWHSLRRKFATELKGANLKDLCALGGWKSHHTVLICYQREDEVTMREALANRKQLVAVGNGD